MSHSSPPPDTSIGDLKIRIDALYFVEDYKDVDEYRKAAKSLIADTLRGLIAEARNCHLHGTFEVTTRAVPVETIEKLIKEIEGNE